MLTVFLPASVSYAENATVDWSKINQGYEILNKEHIKLEQKKAKIAEEYVGQSDVVIASLVTKVNLVGTYRQSLYYTCGPAAARNLIRGYVLTTGSGSTPSEATLASELRTTDIGTEFHSRWGTVLNKYAPGNSYVLKWGTPSNWNQELRTRVLYTIPIYNKGYNVIGNIYHGLTSTPVHPVYQGGAAHYLVIHGYHDYYGYYHIADSYSAVPVQYTAPYTNTANSTQQRGIVW